MTRIYIKYQNNSPVPILTQNLPIPHEEEPVVADLVAAYKTAVAPLLDHSSLAQLTLHLPDGVARSAITEDCFTATDSTGTTLRTGLALNRLNGFGLDDVHPLIIKSKNDMQSPTSSGSSNSVASITNDVIDINTQHLERLELIEKLDFLVSSYNIVLLSSPAGSGKSSLLELYKAATKKNIIKINCLINMTLYELLKNEGIDLKKRYIKEELLRKDVIFFLDDAQAKYDDVPFWNYFIKSGFIPGNIKFIISATHMLNGGQDSPVEFKSFQRLSREDFLLSKEEAYQFLDFSDIGLPQTMSKFDNLKTALVNESGGLIAALRLSVDFLKVSFMKDGDPTEAILLQRYFSNTCVERMARCFGTNHSKPVGDDFKQLLKRCFLEDRTPLHSLADKDDEKSYSILKKAGILVEFPGATFGFSSQLAKRYYFNWIFPNRSLKNPSSISELIKNVIGNMSATILKNSTIPGDFPKEAVFQHLFMDGLAKFTEVECCIRPELSKILSSTIADQQQTIPGEIDFYLNGSLRWGIELLVNGEGIGEHFDRFLPPNGKYVALCMSDYAVVDFRGNATGVPTKVRNFSKRVTVFFKLGDYSIARCYFGDDANIVEINLAN